jgi:hypothetical protein
MVFRWPDGHFYSTVPSQNEISNALRSARSQNDRLKEQIAGYSTLDENINVLFNKVLSQSNSQLRDSILYPQNSTQFVYSDALMLRSVLNDLKPQRIIEVGSGHSSAVLTDYQNSSCGEIKLTMIEPFPQRLEQTLGSAFEYIDLRKCPVQDIDKSLWQELEAGDLLFIDSSHVVKAGSDVSHLFFEVLPILRSGVVIHIHDVFRNFEYPEKWFSDGRFWNESYMLRAFLTFNSRFRIQYWPCSNRKLFKELVASEIGKELEPGSSIYLVVTEN